MGAFHTSIQHFRDGRDRPSVPPGPELCVRCLMYAERRSEAEGALRSLSACEPAGADTRVDPGSCPEMGGEIRAAIREPEAAEELNAHETMDFEVLERLRAGEER